MKVALLLLGIALMTGCSSFDHEWRAAPAQASDIAGRWEGRWQSARTRHNGKLRAVITPQTRERYRARFRATYASVLSAEYSVPLDVKKRAGRSEFRGAADLGVWGRYESTGYATANQFRATYRSKFDHGTFEMQRAAK